MTINTTTLEANLTTKINNTSGTTDGKEFLLLGKAVEAVNTAISNNSLRPSNNLSDVTNVTTARTNLGLGTMATAATSDYAALAGATFTGAIDMGSNNITTTGKILYSNVYSNLSDLPSASTYHGMFAHVHATGKGYYAHGGNWIPIVNEDTSGNVSLGGNLTVTGDFTVNGTTTTINSTTMDVDDLNITVASGAADAAAANGAGITVDGASATFTYANTGDKWTMNKPLDVTGAITSSAALTGTSASISGTVTATGATVNGTLDIEEVKEKVTVSSTDIVSGSNVVAVDLLDGAIDYYTANASGNWTLNFRGDGSNTLDSIMSVGQSMTYALLVTNGGTPRYGSAYQIDGSSVTPKWQGGSAPTAGNANSIDTYSFTIIKTASATFTVLASVTQFA